MRIRTGRLRWIFLLLLTLFLMSGCAVCAQKEEMPRYYGSLGTAKSIAARNAVVSIFVSDRSTAWNFEDPTDLNSYGMVHRCLKLSADWIRRETEKYGGEAELLTDWTQHPELIYAVTLDIDFQSFSEADREQIIAFLDTCIDSEKIMEDCGADGIAYLFFVNAPMACENRSSAWSADAAGAAENECVYEWIVFFPNAFGQSTAPAVYIHELLHLFGAIDLYEVNAGNAGYGVTERFCKHMAWSNDIMAKASRDSFEEIPQELSELDAYYLGLIPDCAERQTWGLK